MRAFFRLILNADLLRHFEENSQCLCMKILTFCVCVYVCFPSQEGIVKFIWPFGLAEVGRG